MSEPASPARSLPPPVGLSPIHRIASRLPAPRRAPPAPKRALLAPPAPSAKRCRTEAGDLRREVLGRVVQSLPGITVTQVPKDASVIELSDSSVEEVDEEVEMELKVGELDEATEDSEKPDENKSVELEERLMESEHPINVDPVVEDKLLQVVGKPVIKRKKKKKLVEIEWKPVTRERRKTKLYSFRDVFGGPAQVEVVGLAAAQRVPAAAGGRRPHVLVPGVDYGLGEGTGLAVTEEERAEIALASLETYALDSFVCDTGHLSEDEMAETPGQDRRRRKVRRRRLDKAPKGKLTFDKIKEAEVVGCLWSTFTSAGWRHNKDMKRWAGLLLAEVPVPTTGPMEGEVEVEGCGEKVVEDVVAPPACSEDWEAWYRAKYLVRRLVEGMVAGPALCSTPVVARRAEVEVGDLVRRVLEREEEELEGQEDLVRRFVTKYFYKWKFMSRV